MLSIQSIRYEEARAVVEDEGMRLKGLIESGDDDDANAVMDAVTKKLAAIGLSQLVLCGIAFRIAAAQADDAEDAMDLLFQLGCDFIELRDWRPV